MNRFTTIFWDVDDTLLDFAYSQRHALSECFRSIGREMTEAELALYTQINDDYWKRLELGEVTKEQLLTGRFLLLFEKLGIEGVDIEAFNEGYQAALGSVYAFLDDSLDICKSLRGKVRQYAVTNGVTATQQNKLERSGLAEVMDGIFISEQVGSPKPSPVFFDYCLEHIEEKDRSRILIVGDSLTSDIKGGIQAGIATCWYHRAADKETDRTDAELSAAYKPDYVIDDLHKVREIVLGESMEKQKGAESDAGIPV